MIRKVNICNKIACFLIKIAKKRVKNLKNKNFHKN